VEQSGQGRFVPLPSLAKLFVRDSPMPIFSIPIRSLRTKWSQMQNVPASRGPIDRIVVTLDSARVKI
jgi:hypothetical protein